MERSRGFIASRSPLNGRVLGCLALVVVVGGCKHRTPEPDPSPERPAETAGSDENGGLGHIFSLAVKGAIAAKDAVTSSSQAEASPSTPTAPAAPPAPLVAPVTAPANTRAGVSLHGKLAVLDLRNFASELTHENVQYFTDVIRQSALRNAPGVEVMTRENLLVLLGASGKKLDECEGECEVDTGRRIGADAIISGELQKLGKRYKVSLRLHDTRGGTLLNSAIGSGGTLEELDDSVAKAAADLFQTP